MYKGDGLGGFVVGAGFGGTIVGNSPGVVGIRRLTPDGSFTQ